MQLLPQARQLGQFVLSAAKIMLMGMSRKEGAK